MPILKSAMQKAREQLAQAEAEFDRWQNTLAGHRTTLAELEATMGADALAAVDEAAVDALQDRLARARSAIDVATAAVGAAEGAVVDARRSLLTAAAGVVRERAKTARADADRHAERTRELLEQLAAHDLVDDDGNRYDGIEYRPIRHTEARGWDVALSRSDVLAARAGHLDALAEEVATAAAGPCTDPALVARMVAAADPDGPEAAEVQERSARHAAEAQAWREFNVAVVAARKEWIARRTAELQAADDGGSRLSAVQAENLALTELNAQRRAVQRGEAGALDGPVGPEQIDAKALELLGVKIDRPAVLAGA